MSAEVPDAVRRAIRLHAVAADEALEGIADPKARAITSLVSATYHFTSALAEASTMLSAGLINQATMYAVDSTLQRLALGADKLLDEPELSRAYDALRIIVAAGVQELITASAEVISTEHPEGAEWRT